MISIVLCVVIYALVGFAVASNLSLEEIIATRNYSLAAAAKPALRKYAVLFTVVLAMLATAGGLIASIFAVSRMLAMLTEMKLLAVTARSILSLGRRLLDIHAFYVPYGVVNFPVSCFSPD